MALDLVAPEVPNAQANKGAEIFLQGIAPGLRAFSAMQEQKRQSEMEMLRLAEHERLSQEQMALEKQKMAQDFDIRQQTLDTAQTVNEAHAEYYKAGAEAYRNNTKTAAQRAIAFNQQRQSLVNEVDKHASELNLYDPVFQAKEPAKFAANVLQFEDAWGLSALPEVKNAVRNFRLQADKQKIPLRAVDADGTAIGQPRQVPIWQVVKNLQDPETKEPTMVMLRANGQLKSETRESPGTATKQWSRPIDSMWDAIIGPTPKKEVVESVAAPLIRDAMSEDVKFERGRSRVPAAMLPKSAAQGTAPTELPQSDVPADTTEDPQASMRPPDFSPSETDTLLGQAKGAIAKGAPMAAVAQRLQELGIDPQTLWAS